MEVTELVSESSSLELRIMTSSVDFTVHHKSLFVNEVLIRFVFIYEGLLRKFFQKTKQSAIFTW